jgi:hypothetical protein
MANNKLEIEVVTRSLADPDQVTRKTINYNNPGDRGWLAKHSLWGLANGFSVTITPVNRYIKPDGQVGNAQEAY